MEKHAPLLHYFFFSREEQADKSETELRLLRPRGPFSSGFYEEFGNTAGNGSAQITKSRLSHSSNKVEHELVYSLISGANQTPPCLSVLFALAR